MYHRFRQNTDNPVHTLPLPPHTFPSCRYSPIWFNMFCMLLYEQLPCVQTYRHYENICFSPNLHLGHLMWIYFCSHQHVHGYVDFMVCSWRFTCMTYISLQWHPTFFLHFMPIKFCTDLWTFKYNCLNFILLPNNHVAWMHATKFAALIDFISNVFLHDNTPIIQQLLLSYWCLTTFRWPCRISRHDDYQFTIYLAKNDVSWRNTQTNWTPKTTGSEGVINKKMTSFH